MRRVAVLCAGGLLTATACTSGRSAPERSVRERSTTPSVSAVGSVPWARAAEAGRERGYPNQKQQGSLVPADAVSESASSGRTMFGLADCGPFLGTSYPAISHDGGQSWRVSGPELWRAAAQGGAAVEYIAASGAVVALWGSSIVTSPDGGRTWWRAYLGQGARTVLARDRTLTALAQGDPVPGQPGLMQTARYRSSDGGLSWRLLGRTTPTPAGPTGPHGSAHPTCG